MYFFPESKIVPINMGRPKNTKTKTPTHKLFANRQRGLMKKGNTLYRLTGAHVAILLEFDGVVYSYQSDNRFASDLSHIPKQQLGPDHYDTVADRSRSRLRQGDAPPQRASVQIMSLSSSPSSIIASPNANAQAQSQPSFYSALDLSTPPPTRCEGMSLQGFAKADTKVDTTSLSMVSNCAPKQQSYPLAKNFFTGL